MGSMAGSASPVEPQPAAQSHAAERAVGEERDTTACETERGGRAGDGDEGRETAARETERGDRAGDCDGALPRSVVLWRVLELFVILFKITLFPACAGLGGVLWFRQASIMSRFGQARIQACSVDSSGGFLFNPSTGDSTTGAQREDVVWGLLPWALTQVAGLCTMLVVGLSCLFGGYTSSAHAATTILGVLVIAAAFLGPTYDRMVDRLAAPASLEAWDAEHSGDPFAWIAAVMPPMLQGTTFTPDSHAHPTFEEM